MALLNQDLREAQGQRYRYQQNSIRLESDLKDTREAFGRLQVEYDGKAAEAEEAKKKLGTAEGSIAELKQTVSDGNTQLEEMKRAKDAAKEEKERAIEGMRNAAESNRMAFESKEKAEKEIVELRALVDEETKRANTAEETMRQLGSENATLRAENATFEEENATLKEEIARKEGVIKKLLEQKRGGKKRKKTSTS